MVKYLFILNIAIYVIWTTPSNAGSLISKPYPQKSLLCKGHEFKIPDFPLVTENSDNLYLIYDETNCVPDKIEIVLGFGKGCHGQNMCMVGRFGIMKIDNVFLNRLERLMKSAHRTVIITDPQQGYFSPSECNAYCTPSQLTWFQDGYAYMLDSIVDINVQEKMVKAAREYIERHGEVSK